MSLFGSLDIGRSGLNAAKQGQSISGQNIANADTEGYTRQQVINQADVLRNSGKQAGVRSDDIRRIHDQFTEKKITSETSTYFNWKTKSELLQNAEFIFNDLNTSGVSASIQDFFDAWLDLSNNPESTPIRRHVIEKAQAMIARFQTYDQQIESLQNNIGDQIELEIKQVNQIINQIAELNLKIQNIQSKNGNANALEDERTALVKQLAEKFDIIWAKDEQGMIDVKTSQGRSLVNGTTVNQLKFSRDTNGQSIQNQIIIEYNDVQTNIADEITNGSFGAKLMIKDQFLEGKRDNLNQLLETISMHVNEIHAKGNQYSQNLKTAQGINTLSQSEIDVPLPYLEDGVASFKIIAPSGDEEILEIPIQAGVDSAQTIMSKINTLALAFIDTTSQTAQVNLDSDETTETDEMSPSSETGRIPKTNPPFVATISPEGNFQLKTNLGFEFQYDKDDSNVLSILGLNSFFKLDSENLSEVTVNESIVTNPLLINTGKSDPGDNSLALAVSQLNGQLLMNDGTASFEEYYNNELTDIGSQIQESNQKEQLHKEIYDQYLAIRESVSGVNVDEELTNMVKYQRAYEASAKYINTVDEMTQTLINL